MSDEWADLRAKAEAATPGPWAEGTRPRCGYLGCGHHKGHRGTHTWSEIGR